MRTAALFLFGWLLVSNSQAAPPTPDSGVVELQNGQHLPYSVKHVGPLIFIHYQDSTVAAIDCMNHTVTEDIIGYANGVGVVVQGALWVKIPEDTGWEAIYQQQCK